jgi:PAS domain S-box-containing protein
MTETSSTPRPTPLFRPPLDGWSADVAAHAVNENVTSFMPLTLPLISFETIAAIANRMSDGACLLNSAGYIRYVNPVMRELLGRSEAELLDKPIDAFRDDLSVDSEAWTASRRVGIARWRRADGVVFEARMAVEPLIEGADQGTSLLLLTPTAAPVRNDVDDSARADGQDSAAQRWVQVIETVADVELASLPVNDAIEAILNRISPALELENAAVWLYSTSGDMLEVSVATGAGREFAGESRIPANDPTILDVFAEREPKVFNDADAILRNSGFFPESLFGVMSVQSMLLAPLIVDDQAIGLFYLGSAAPDHFTVDDIRLARVAVARIALAIGESRARQAAMVANRRMTLLAEAGATLVGSLDHNVIAKRLVECVTPSYADACALYLVQEDGLAHKIAVGEPQSASGLVEPAHVAVMRALAGLPEAMSSLKLPPHLEQTLSQRRKIGVARLEAAAITPVLVESHGHPVGVLFLIEGTGRDLDPDDLILIRSLAMRAAIGMELARLYSELDEALKRVSESAMQLDTIFESTDAGIFITDASGHFYRMNAYGARMLGASEFSPSLSLSREMRPRNSQLKLYQLLDEQGREIPREELPLYLAISTKEPAERRMFIHLLSTGQDTPVLIRCSPLRDGHGQVTGVVGVITDITGIHEIERQKDEFLGVVSHELKTPLTTLKILAQMLSRRMRATNEPRALEQAERMTTAISRMERLIFDLLDASRIHEGKLTLSISVCDLGAICRDAVREQEIISQRNITLYLPDQESLSVHADMERLRQVVVNLLSNALKYSPTTAPVTLRIRESGSNYLVSVEDRGPGLPLSEQGRLFQRFYRAPSVRVQSGSGVGLGLGLFISREIIDAHDGEIWVEGEPGHGSVFIFSIPRAGHAHAEDLE